MMWTTLHTLWDLGEWKSLPSGPDGKRGDHCRGLTLFQGGQPRPQLTQTTQRQKMEGEPHLAVPTGLYHWWESKGQEDRSICHLLPISTCSVLQPPCPHPPLALLRCRFSPPSFSPEIPSWGSGKKTSLPQSCLTECQPHCLPQPRWPLSR